MAWNFQQYKAVIEEYPLVKARLEHDLTNKELARIAGVKYKTWLAILKGQRRVNGDFMRGLRRLEELGYLRVDDVIKLVPIKEDESENVTVDGSGENPKGTGDTLPGKPADGGPTGRSRSAKPDDGRPKSGKRWRLRRWGTS